MTAPRNTLHEWATMVDENRNRVGEEFHNTVDKETPMGDSRIIRVTNEEIVFLRYAKFHIPNHLVFLKYNPQTGEIEVFGTNAEGLVTI